MLLPEQLPAQPEGEDQHVRDGQGVQIGNDGIWLDGQTTDFTDATDLVLSKKLVKRCSLLVKHLYVFRQKGAV